MKFIDLQTDPWVRWGKDTPASDTPMSDAPAILSLAEWQSARDAWPPHRPVGVQLANSEDVEALEQDLPRLSLVVVEFPKFTDGRAFSQARLLRRRYRFAGEIRAVGDVLVDLMQQLERCGVDAAVLRADQDVAVAQRARDMFKAHYQGDVHEPRPLFVRQPDPANKADKGPAHA